VVGATVVVLTVLAGAAIGAVLHRYRGGGIRVIPRFPGRSLWGAALAFGALAWWVLGPLIGAALFLAYLGGSVSGWGSWFDLGRKRDGWSDSPEVPWIDEALLHLFGPEWATDAARIHPVRRFHGDAVYHEGGVRPAWWRWSRDFTGLFLRGWHYWPMFWVLPLAGQSGTALAIGSAAVALFAPAYWLAYRVGAGTGLAEWIVGGIFGAGLAAQWAAQWVVA